MPLFPSRRAVLAGAAALSLPLAALPALAGDVPAWSQGFDPKRDPAADLAEAQALAAASGRRILMDVGGDWCVWCKLLDHLFATDAALRDQRDRHFVLLKVHYDKAEVPNTAFLSRYPKIGGYPHLFVLAADGSLLHSQDTAELELPKEAGKGHDRDKVQAFLAAWAPPLTPS